MNSLWNTGLSPNQGQLNLITLSMHSNTTRLFYQFDYSPNPDIIIRICSFHPASFCKILTSFSLRYSLMNLQVQEQDTQRHFVAFLGQKKVNQQTRLCSVENSDNKNPPAGKFFSFFITFHIFNIFLPIYIRICKAYTKFDTEF